MVDRGETTSERRESNEARPTRHWASIQYLRGFAALLVVVFHVCVTERPFNPLSGFKAGAHGVDVFFIISGFVMYTAARHESVGTFYRRRLSRIVPLYWLATLAAVAVHVCLTGQAISRLNLARSMAFVPFFNPSFDGKIWPLLVPGWTLNYEMFFYVLFGVMLAIRRPLLLVWLILPALVALGYCFRLPNALWLTYTSPLLLEFAAGLVIGRLVTLVDLRLLVPLLPLGAVLLLLSDLSRLPPVLSIGAASVAIVVGALALEVGGRLPRWRWPTLLGDASYSLYLVHTPVIDLIDKGVATLPLSAVGGFALFAFVALAASLGLGLVTHLLVEKPLTRWLNRAPAALLVRRRQSTSPS